ncbi:hypothetical protein A3D11_02060 [Candidatus Peribacteria bacterium RIFCSPHIGHO2_02_FULL_49_16]|nr:MAG: hypothetical protein A2880_01170 [Candidatus Peribacteria bacterium RIFCSPHIGHO2_01_FULL_49_38]OGJ58698.1 MAG: hypothetical protein A3D11_02060 [Candidatus Peribacteria bacterium RIFCSPHIGHO2_02_FULL_49_16]
MKKSEILFGILRVPLDAVAVCAALLLSYSLRDAQIDLIPRLQLLEPAETLPDLFTYVQFFVLPGAAVFLVLAALLKLYALRLTASAWNEVGRIIITALLWLVCIMAWFFFVQKQLFYSRILLVHSTFFIALFIILLRSMLVLIQRSFLYVGIGVRYVASVGKTHVHTYIKNLLENDQRYCFLGHFSSLDELRKCTDFHMLDTVFHTSPHPGDIHTEELTEFCRSQHISYACLPPVFADVPHHLCVEYIGLLPVLRYQPTPLDGWGRVLKRGMDVTLSCALFVVLFPLLLIIVFAIVCDSGFPIFYVSQRIGDLGKKRFGMVKFRSMTQGADKMKKEFMTKNHRRDGPLFKLRNDPRVTRAGRVLRRWSLDELPQLWNVFLGNMALVGPRPHLPEEVQQYEPYQCRVFAVRPGLTGLAQITGRSDLSFDEEVRLDLQYIEYWSPWLDVWILWRTIVVVLSKKGAD